MDDLMKEADSLVNGDRHEAYGAAKEAFDAYGLAWTALLRNKLKPGAVIDASDVTLLMAALKLVRESNKAKRDNVVDAHGYLSLHSQVTAL